MATPHAGDLHGIVVPTVTPLDPDEDVDLPSLGRLLDYLIESGVHGLWLVGTTGEFASLLPQQRDAAVEYGIDHVAGRVPVVVNVGDGSTRLAIRNARHALRCGAQALALTPPHYYLHSMDETAAHFRAVKQVIGDVPLYAYNIPSTVKVRITVPVLLGLAADRTAAGVKDSQNDLDFLRALMLGLERDGTRAGFRVFAGTRTLIDASVLLGADGAIPAVSNIAPAECVAAYEAAAAGDATGARPPQEIAIAYNDLAGVARGGSSNAGSIASMKEVLRMRGILSHATVTAPLRPFTDHERAELYARVGALEAGEAPERSHDGGVDAIRSR